MCLQRCLPSLILEFLLQNHRRQTVRLKIFHCNFCRMLQTHGRLEENQASNESEIGMEMLVVQN